MIIYYLINLFALFLNFSSSTQKDDMKGNPSTQEIWWVSKAEKMVASQIIARGIKNPDVIRVMKTTPRHKFVPEYLRDHAYEDRPLPIGSGQTISQPYIVALMTEYLQLSGNEKVLEIGTGSGYQAAILAQLVDTCYSIEVYKSLAEEAAERLMDLGYHNVVVRWGDGYQGWPDMAPFDRIIITAAPESIPDEIVKQLGPDGRMVLPVGSNFQELILITRTGKGLKRENIIPVRFVPMIHPENPIFNE